MEEGPINHWKFKYGPCVKYQLQYLKTNCGEGSLQISHEKYIPYGKILAHFGFTSKVLSVPLSDLSAWVGFCTSSPLHKKKIQISKLIFDTLLWA
jgi:hypothetical protein